MCTTRVYGIANKSPKATLLLEVPIFEFLREKDGGKHTQICAFLDRRMVLRLNVTARRVRRDVELPLKMLRSGWTMFR
jgi:hypothetical protein